MNFEKLRWVPSAGTRYLLFLDYVTDCRCSGSPVQAVAPSLSQRLQFFHNACSRSRSSSVASSRVIDMFLHWLKRIGRVLQDTSPLGEEEEEDGTIGTSHLKAPTGRKVTCGVFRMWQLEASTPCATRGPCNECLVSTRPVYPSFQGIVGFDKKIQ
ncbi:hypothetical protein PsorP6_001879 [Peronosclerospora sorghi]|uniref:Uncharacterized protein n=1 Tax=Peronosclerospora sorghi TaxID=230839 RepID=A0ACC0WV70_9STRA|nr:hypothetical protein PsorP6_001879 [Peronosclerospora sorghi]